MLVLSFSDWLHQNLKSSILFLYSCFFYNNYVVLPLKNACFICNQFCLNLTAIYYAIITTNLVINFQIRIQLSYVLSNHLNFTSFFCIKHWIFATKHYYVLYYIYYHIHIITCIHIFKFTIHFTFCFVQ